MSSDYHVGANPAIDPGATVGYVHDETAPPARIGDDATIRTGTVIYRDVTVGDGFSTGHNALVREETTIGDDVLVGTGVVVDGRTTIGSHTSLQTGAYLPPDTTLESEVFLGPNATLTDDPYPVRAAGDDHRRGPTVESGATVGANATVLPGVTVGEDAFVAAGAVVTRDVPPETLAVGAPAAHEPLPEHLAGGNSLA